MTTGKAVRTPQAINGKLESLIERMAKLETKQEECERRFEELCRKIARQTTGWNRVVDMASKVALPVALLLAGIIMQHDRTIGSLQDRVSNLPPRYLQDAVTSNTSAIASMVEKWHLTDTRLAKIEANVEIILKTLEKK